MGNIIVVSPEHRLPTPLVYNLGTHSLIVTSDYGAPDAFELAAPVIDEASLPDDALQHSTVILDHDEAYHLYQCLHTSLFVPQHGENVV
jgi:hypothetical protein